MSNAQPPPGATKTFFKWLVAASRIVIEALAIHALFSGDFRTTMKRLLIAALLIAGVISFAFLITGLFDYLYIRYLLSPFSRGIKSINFVNPHIGKGIVAAVSAVISFLCIRRMRPAHTTGRKVLMLILPFPFALAFVSHTLLTFGTWGANFDSEGRALLRFEVMPDNSVVYYPSYWTKSPRTGRPLRILTAQAVTELEARKVGKLTEVKDPQWDDFFAPGTGDPRLWYRRLGEGYRFFNAPAWDLLPVTTEVRSSYFKMKSEIAKRDAEAAELEKKEKLEGEWASNTWKNFLSHSDGEHRRAVASSKGDTWTYDMLAWHLATCTIAAHRDSKYAVRLAELAVKLDPSNPVFLDTLAAAYARSGKFQEAIETEVKAINESKSQAHELPEERGPVQNRLDGYRKHIAYVCDDALDPKTQKAREAAAIQKGLMDLDSHGRERMIDVRADLDAGEAGAYNRLAWHWATCGNQQHIDAQRALQFAQEAVRRQPKSPNYVDTLAAAYARLARFDDAIATEQKALVMIESENSFDSGMHKIFEGRLAVYRKHFCLIADEYKQ